MNKEVAKKSPPVFVYLTLHRDKSGNLSAFGKRMRIRGRTRLLSGEPILASVMHDIPFHFIPHFFKHIGEILR